MRKKQLLSLILALVLALSLLPAANAASEETAAAVKYSAAVLAAGDLSASVTILCRNAGQSEKFICSLGYYAADGTLLDFSAAAAETEYKYAYYIASATLKLNIPADISGGQYVRTIIMDGKTLEPLTVQDGYLVCDAFVTGTETVYDGMSERYYTLDSGQGSVVLNGSAVTIAESGTPFRLKDMGEGYVAFASYSSPKRRLSFDGSVKSKLYGFGGESMLWKLVPAEDGEYYVEHYGGGYLAVENGNIKVGEAPTAFRLNFVGETPFTLMTSLEGFKLLDEKTQNRIIEIYTSVGAGIFPSGSNADSLLETAENSFSELYKNRESLTAEKQRDKILEIVQTPPSYNSGETNEMSAASVKDLPGAAEGTTVSAPVKESLSIWDRGYKEYNRVDVTYTCGDQSQTVKFYYDESGKNNLDAAIEALGRFPYEYRRYIEQVNIYVPESSFTFNCDGSVMTVRVMDGTGAETMARNFAHELGHSVEFCLYGANISEIYSDHWCQSGEWQLALTEDLIPVSIYGNSNHCEGFAEFSRLYFQCYGSRDRQIGIKQLFPNRLASFENLLEKIEMGPLY